MLNVSSSKKISFVSVCCKRQRIQLRRMQLRPRSVHHNLAVFAETRARNRFKRFAMCKFGHGVVKLASHYKIDVFARVQRLFRLDVTMRANKGDLQPWIRFLDFPDQLEITVETNS